MHVFPAAEIFNGTLADQLQKYLDSYAGSSNAVCMIERALHDVTYIDLNISSQLDPKIHVSVESHQLKSNFGLSPDSLTFYPLIEPNKNVTNHRVLNKYMKYEQESGFEIEQYHDILPKCPGTIAEAIDYWYQNAQLLTNETFDAQQDNAMIWFTTGFLEAQKTSDFNLQVVVSSLMNNNNGISVTFASPLVHYLHPITIVQLQAIGQQPLKLPEKFQDEQYVFRAVIRLDTNNSSQSTVHERDDNPVLLKYPETILKNEIVKILHKVLMVGINGELPFILMGKLLRNFGNVLFLQYVDCKMFILPKKEEKNIEYCVAILADDKLSDDNIEKIFKKLQCTNGFVWKIGKLPLTGTLGVNICIWPDGKSPVIMNMSNKKYNVGSIRDENDINFVSKEIEAETVFQLIEIFNNYSNDQFSPEISKRRDEFVDVLTGFMGDDPLFILDSNKIEKVVSPVIYAQLYLPGEDSKSTVGFQIRNKTGSSEIKKSGTGDVFLCEGPDGSYEKDV